MTMQKKIIITVLIVLSVVAYVGISGGSKEVYKVNSGLIMKIWWKGFDDLSILYIQLNLKQKLKKWRTILNLNHWETGHCSL